MEKEKRNENLLSSNPYLFTDEDRSAARLLIELGMPRPLAHTVLYLSRTSEAISPHIETGAGLKQPEVSTAIGKLRHSGWIDQRTVNRKCDLCRRKSSYRQNR